MATITHKITVLHCHQQTAEHRVKRYVSNFVVSTGTEIFLLARNDGTLEKHSSSATGM